jgi:hypothetical protein
LFFNVSLSNNKQDLCTFEINLVSEAVVENFLSSRSSILSQLSVLEENTLSPRQLEAISLVMSISSSRASKVAVLGAELISSLPNTIKTMIEAWNSSANTDYPSIGSWVSLEHIQANL